MNISKEAKTGIIAIVAICLFIYGYSFLKGSNIFSNENTYYVNYNNVAGLDISAPVTINGFAIGKVKKIDFGTEPGSLVVTFSINGDFEFSKTSIVEIYSTSFIGGNALAIKPDYTNSEMAQEGDTLKGSIQRGMLESVTSGLEPLEKKLLNTLSGLDTLLYNFNSVLNDTTKGDLKEAIASLNHTMNSFERASNNLDHLLQDNKPKLDSTFTYLETTTDNLAQFSDSLSQVEINALATSLQGTLDHFESIMRKINDGDGSVGQLINNEELYNNLEGASKELEELIRDFKLYPERYVNVSVFGKKTKPYKESKDN